ncbi:hypothetical protein [Corynebacterium glyciniphilum]|uniref:hypothetical protein n=1 Tax=Corynebacterium glyciniphilum TaxID=1404244 RepID=UPI0011AB82D4|nr:hypothetical protein [Corynebacterium glyciniphilum]
MTTKKSRIEALIDDGMTRIEAEFQVAKQDLEEQEKRIETAAIDVIKTDFPDTWEAALAVARESVLKPKRRRKTAKKTDTEDAVMVTDSVTESVTENNGYSGF